MNEMMIAIGGEQRGPYTWEQVARMWSDGKITADAVYWMDGMSEWEPVKELNLDRQLKAVPQQQVMPAQPYHNPVQPAPVATVVHTGKVTTKNRGSGIVAAGSLMCIAGVIMIPFGGAGVGLGVLLLFCGFFVAVVGRLMS